MNDGIDFRSIMNPAAPPSAEKGREKIQREREREEGGGGKRIPAAYKKKSLRT